MSNPLFSIIVPVYKVEAYLEDCVNSILSQDYRDFELLLVDDGSPDGCPDICDRYAAEDSRVRVFHKENGGVSSARNLGISHAKGDWIWFIDSDDYIFQGSLKYLYNSLLRTSSDLYCFNQTHSNTYTYDEPTFFPEHYFSYRLLYSPCYKIYRRSIIMSHSIRFDTEEKVGEDLLFNAAYYQHMTQFTFIPETFYCYVDRSDSAMHSNKQERLTIQLRLYQKLIDIYRNHISDENRCILFLMHLFSGLKQSKGSGTNHAPVLSDTFPSLDFNKTIWKTSVKQFLRNEHATFFGKVRARLFLSLCNVGWYRLAAKFY